MADKPVDAADALPKKKSKLPLILGLVLMLALGGGGYFAVHSGLLFGTHEKTAEAVSDTGDEPVHDIAFVPIDPLIISLESTAEKVHLRFSAQLEVVKAHEEEVRLLLPRVSDVLNSYLRAVEVGELEKPTALVKLRAQLVRRIQLVAGEGRVRDLLVTEFVIN